MDPLSVFFAILAFGKKGDNGGGGLEPAPQVPSPGAYIDPQTGDVIDPGVVQPGLQSVPGQPWQVPSPAGKPFVMPPPGVLPDVPQAPSMPPAVTPQAPPWPSVVPAGLPPFPGPGWTAVSPLTAGIIDRASYWNPILWNFPTKTIVQPFVQEQFGGEMLTFKAAWHPSPANPQFMATEAYRLASGPAAVTPAQPQAPFPVAPPAVPGDVLQVPQTQITPGPAPGMQAPSPVGPEPAPGAWRSNSGYIHRYQAALSYLASLGNPTWDPGGVDGLYGPNTASAVRAFQGANGLPVDGQVGNQTASAIDSLLPQ